MHRHLKNSIESALSLAHERLPCRYVPRLLVTVLYVLAGYTVV
jgi:hypothetical protein